MKKFQFIIAWIAVIALVLVFVIVYNKPSRKTVLPEQLNLNSAALNTNVPAVPSAAAEVVPTIEDKLIQKYNIIPDQGLDVMTMSWNNKRVIIESNKQDKVVFVEDKYVDVSQAAYRIYIKSINGDKVRIDDYPDNICHGGNFRPCLDPLMRPVAWTIDDKLIIVEDAAGSGAVPLFTTFLFDPVTKEVADLATGLGQFSADKKYVAYTINSDNTPEYCYDGPDAGFNSGQLVIKEVETNNVLFIQAEKNTEYEIIKFSDQIVEFKANKVELRDEIPCVFSTGQTASYLYDLNTGKMVNK